MGTKKNTLAILALLCAIPTAHAVVLQGNITNWWTFDDPGNLGAPQVGTVTLSGNATSGAGVGGDSPLALDAGNGGFLSAGAEGSLDLTGNFSYSLWVRRTGGGQFLKPFQHTTTGDGGGFAQVENNGGGGVVWNVRINGTNSELQTDPFLQDGNWHHVALTRTANIVDIFVDGAPINFGGVDTSLDPALNLVGTSGLGIGAEANGNSPFPGLIDDFRMYNVPLTQADAAAIYNGGAGDFIPEPTTSVLAVVGLLSLGLMRRRRA